MTNTPGLNIARLGSRLAARPVATGDSAPVVDDGEHRPHRPLAAVPPAGDNPPRTPTADSDNHGGTRGGVEEGPEAAESIVPITGSTPANPRGRTGTSSRTGGSNSSSVERTRDGGRAKSAGAPEPHAAAERPSTQASDHAVVTRNVALSVALPIREAARDTARSRRTTQAELLYSAIEDYVESGTHVQLPVQGSLFTRRSVPTRTDAPRVVMTVRMTTINLGIIDTLTEDSGHPNRSSLVEAALRRYLDPGSAIQTNETGNADSDRRGSDA